MKPDTLQRLSTGDPVAFRELYDEHFQKVYRQACYLVKNTEEAEEITQRVFIKVWDSRKQIAKALQTNAYLQSIMRNIVYWDAYEENRERRLRQMYLRTINMESDGYDPIRTKEFIADFMKALRSVIPAHRRAFVLSFCHSFNREECAQRLGIAQQSFDNYMVLTKKKIIETMVPIYGEFKICNNNKWAWRKYNKK